MVWFAVQTTVWFARLVPKGVYQTKCALWCKHNSTLACTIRYVHLLGINHMVYWNAPYGVSTIVHWHVWFVRLIPNGVYLHGGCRLELVPNHGMVCTADAEWYWYQTMVWFARRMPYRYQTMVWFARRVPNGIGTKPWYGLHGGRRLVLVQWHVCTHGVYLISCN